ncbi:GPI mannosyltransferase 2 subunit Pga1p [[Candida] anglica]|uniref:GPI mannosyltransferase 2 subunit Pga1p n=1 Tax=[Candida] anglica TaxID=148631 RepID=A0ABP0EHK9_9ASCO
MHPILFLLFAAFVQANTESYLLQIPHYYSITPHPEPYVENGNQVFTLNKSHSVLENYPILNKYDHEDLNSVVVHTPYEYEEGGAHTLLVKLNNYNNSAFQSDDKIYIKVCWPATQPFSVDISHQFLEGLIDGNKELEPYILITYQVDAYPSKPEYALSLDTFTFNLHVSRLPWIPLPLELVDIMMYLGDLAILVIMIGVPVLEQMV